MTTPSVTLRSLQNKETGIDISAPSILEEEAPLGGTSILYEISVYTTLETFKTKIHKSEDVVHFSIFKAYREIEDFCNKIRKKFSTVSLPSIPATSSKREVSREDKLNSINDFMKVISQDVDICSCTIFAQFIGINSLKQSSLTNEKEESTQKKTTVSKIHSSDVVHKTESTEENVEEVGQVVLDFGKKLQDDKIKDENFSDMFPKMRAVESKTKNDVHKEQSNKLGTTTATRSTVQNVDLFEEVKIVKEIEKAGIAKKNVSQGLFEDFEDDSLFSSIPSKKTSVKKKIPSEKVKTIEKEERKDNNSEKSKTKLTEIVNDDEIIIKDRKIGEVSLFETQDLGDYITKEEESLFLVTPSSRNESKKNTLMFLEDDDSTSISKETSDENLDDLLNLEPLPSATSEERVKSPTSPDLDELLNSETSPSAISEELKKNPPMPSISSETTQDLTIKEETEKELPPKPVPRPRKKSIETPNQGKPEVLPRKVFLNNEAPLTTKPSVPPRPKPKPKLPAKKPSLAGQKGIEQIAKKIDDNNANESPINQNLTSDISDELDKMDILKYIEQEEKSASAQPSLFD